MGGDYDGAFEHLKRAVDHSRYVGWLHQNGAWNFELLDVLESRGFVHPEWNYRNEIQRMLNWDDIYMRGVSYRYRALRLLEKQTPMSRVMADLKKSEKYLQQSGAEIELARTRIALGNLYVKQGELKTAHAYLGKAWRFFSTVDQNLFPKDLLAIMPQEQKMEVMIDRIIAINESLGTLQDLSSFLERAINLALDLTMAMRGAFFTPGPGGALTLTASRNLDPSILRREQVTRLLEVVRRNGAAGSGGGAAGARSGISSFRAGPPGGGHSFPDLPAGPTGRTDPRVPLPGQPARPQTLPGRRPPAGAAHRQPDRRRSGQYPGL